MTVELFFSPMACSLASRIALHEAGVPAVFRRVTLSTKALDDGGSLLDVSPKGQVPTLRLDDGAVLTEGAAVLQYIADLAPHAGLAPANGTVARYELQSWLSYIATEIHKQVFWTLFAPTTPQEAKGFARALIPGKLDYLERRLSDRETLTGQGFTVADAYLTWALLLIRRIGVDLSGWPAVAAFLDRSLARPAVRRAVDEETALLSAA